MGFGATDEGELLPDEGSVIDESDITREMRDAGAAVIDENNGVVTNDYLAMLVYMEMAKLDPTRSSEIPSR